MSEGADDDIPQDGVTGADDAADDGVAHAGEAGAGADVNSDGDEFVDFRPHETIDLLDSADATDEAPPPLVVSPSSLAPVAQQPRPLATTPSQHVELRIRTNTGEYVLCRLT